MPALSYGVCTVTGGTVNDDAVQTELVTIRPGNACTRRSQSSGGP